MTVLMENVRHHVEEEEEEWFPKVRAIDRNACRAGRTMETAKPKAPADPHPRSPDTPPGNLAAAAGAGMVDRIGDTVSGVAEGSVDRGAGPDRPHPRPPEAVGLTDRVEGGPQHRRREVRGGASKITDDAVAAAVRAKRTAATAAAGAKTASAAVDGTEGHGPHSFEGCEADRNHGATLHQADGHHGQAHLGEAFRDGRQAHLGAPHCPLRRDEEGERLDPSHGEEGDRHLLILGRGTPDPAGQGPACPSLRVRLVGAQSQARILVVPDEIAQGDGVGPALEAAEDGPEQPGRGPHRAGSRGARPATPG